MALPVKYTDLQAKLLESIPKCRTLNDAARMAGYSETSAENIQGIIAKSEKLRNGIKQLYLDNNYPQLFQISNIEQQIIDLCQTDIQEVPKFKSVLKEIKQQTGILQHDTDNKPSYVSIAIDARKAILHYDTEPIQDAEVVE